MKKIVLALAISSAFAGFAMAESIEIEDRAGCDITTNSCIYAGGFKPSYADKCGYSDSLSATLCRLREGLRINYK